MVVDEPRKQLANALEELVEIENGGKLAADVVEQSEGLRLAREAGVKTRIFYAGSDARSHQGEQVLVLFGEVVRLPRFNIDHTDHAVFRDERHRQLCPHPGGGANIAAFLADVIHQHCLTFLHRKAGNPFAYFYANTFRELGRMSDGEAHPQLLRLFVEQQNGKNLVIDRPPHLFGSALQQGIEVERGVDHVGHFHQEAL